MVWNAPKINFRKKLLARTDARVYARVWEHDVDRNDNDFVHEKFEWLILTFRCGDTNLLQYYVDRTSKHIFINSTQNATSHPCRSNQNLEQTTFAHQDTDEPSIIIQIQSQRNS